MAATGVTPGTYGDSTHVAVVTVGADGRITGVTPVTIVGGGGGTGGAPSYETFAGPASSVTLAVTPIMQLVKKNGIGLHLKTAAGAPAIDQYKISGNVLTVTLAAADILDVWEWTAGGPSYETFPGPASGVVLSMSPSLVIVNKNGVGLHLKTAAGAPAIDQYKISGANVTVTLAASDVLDVWEWA